MSIQLSDLRLILGRFYLIKCTKTSECRHKLISWSVMLNLFLPFLYKIAPLVKSCGDQWPEQQLQVSNYFSMAGGQERNLKIEESLPLGTTKVGVEEKMELKRTRVLKLGLKEIAWSIFWLPASNSISWLQYQYSLIESIFAKICRFFQTHAHKQSLLFPQVCMNMVQGSVKISVRPSGQFRELQFLLPFVNSYELPDIFWFSGNCCPRRYIQKWPQSTRASSSWLLCRVRETEGPHNPFRG